MKVMSALVNRLEPGQLWVHLARPGQGGMTVAGLVAGLAIERSKDTVVCTYDGPIESMLPDDIGRLVVESQAALVKPDSYPIFIELGTIVVPAIRFSNRSFVVVDAARKSDAMCDLDDWKTLARDIRHPVMIYWELDAEEDPEDYDPGDADYMTWSFYNPEKEDELVIRKVHEPG